MAYKVGDRVTLSQDVQLVTRHTGMLRKGDSGTVTGPYANNLYGVHFDGIGATVLISPSQMVHAVDQLAAMRARLETQRIEMCRAYTRHGDELASLRAQLAARDAALDAVLMLAKNWEHHGFVDYRNCGRELTAELLKHGVCPK